MKKKLIINVLMIFIMVFTMTIKSNAMTLPFFIISSVSAENLNNDNAIQKHEIKIGDSLQLYGMIVEGNDVFSPEDEIQHSRYILCSGNLQHITWESNKPEIATVDSTGKVTGVADGTAIISAHYNAEEDEENQDPLLTGRDNYYIITVGEGIAFTPEKRRKFGGYRRYSLSIFI